MNFSIEELPEDAEERHEYVRNWSTEEGLEVSEPSFLQEDESYSLPEMMGMATETGRIVLDTLVFAGEEALPEELQPVVNVDPRDDDPGLSPALSPEQLNEYWSLTPHIASSHAEANIPGNQSTKQMLEDYEGLMMAEAEYDGQKVADILLGPVLGAHIPYGPEIGAVMREESAAVASAAEQVTGEEIESFEDLEGLDVLPYESSEVPVSDSGEITTDKPVVAAWYDGDDTLYLVPERVSVAVGNEEETAEAYVGSIRGGYVDLGDGNIQAPFPPIDESENLLESEQDYFTTLHNI
jgi:hypothetical protein